MRTKFLYAAYSWLLFAGVMHFGIDVISQYLRGRRPAGPETTLYYGLNTSYAVGQVLMAALALLLLHSGSPVLYGRPGMGLGFLAAAAWLTICFQFIEYPQPRIIMAVFTALLISAALAA